MDAENLTQLQNLFQISPDNPITLRAIGGHGYGLPAINANFHAHDYPIISDRWSAFWSEAERLNALRYNIYTCLNPIRPDFRGEAVKDADILCRKLLLIDLDRHETQNRPATDEDIQHAWDVSEKIVEWFHARFPGDPIRIMSGNGIHIHWGLDDLPNSPDVTFNFKRTLNLLADKFNTDVIKVDTSVSNASRITKVPGTIARKGEESEGRPFRKVMFL